MRHKGNIVVADGTAERRAVARRLLRADGFAVLSVASSEELLSVLQQAAPDCVLLAADLPTAGGITLCRLLKARRPCPPLLLIHGSDPLEREAGLAAGADDFLPQPMQRAELLARVRSHAAAHQKAAQLALQAAALSEHNRKLEAELAVAREVQMRLLPPCLPSVDGLWMGALYEPSTAVSGDFYDLRILGPGRVGVFVADVEGHGAPAALVTALLKVLFHNLTEQCHDPARIMGVMNQQLAGLFAGVTPVAVTALCAVFDLAAGEMRVARAGHPPAAIMHLGEVALLEAAGFPLGWFPASEYQAQALPLAAGDRVVMYTDGLFEALGVGDGSGLDRLAGFLRRNAAASGPELLGQMQAMAHAAAARQDDLSTLLLQVGGRSK